MYHIILRNDVYFCSVITLSMNLLFPKFPKDQITASIGIDHISCRTSRNNPFKTSRLEMFT